MWVLVVAGSLVIFSYIPFQFIINPHPALYVVSGITLAYWLYFFMKGVTKNLEASFRPHHITKLITTGVYGMVRHPIYSADIVLGWGIFFAYPLASVLYAVVWLTLMLVFWSYIEEKSLYDLFGNEYRDYTKRVPMLFPFKKI